MSVNVSGREWDDFNGQVQDAIAFLERYGDELRRLAGSHDLETFCLDFPIWSRISDNILAAFDHLPAALIRLAGQHGLGIEMSYYSREM